VARPDNDDSTPVARSGAVWTDAREVRRPPLQRAFATCAAVACALTASAAAAVGWARTPPPREGRAPSIRIVDVRPLRSPDAGLRDLITHTFAVRVATRAWTLLPYEAGATATDNRPGAGHWRLYLDGQPLGDNFGDEHVSYVYVPPGTHWLAAELGNADSTSLDPAVWSEPVILHVPRVIRCWQTGWRGTPETATPTFRCSHRKTAAIPFEASSSREAALVAQPAGLDPFRVVEAILSQKEEK
jgi:hypothetical protein